MTTSAELQILIVRELDTASALLKETRMLSDSGYGEHTARLNQTKHTVVKKWHTSLIAIAELAGVPTTAFKGI